MDNNLNIRAKNLKKLLKDNMNKYLLYIYLYVTIFTYIWHQRNKQQKKMINKLDFKMLLQRRYLMVAQSCPSLSDPIDYSLPGSSVHGDSSGKSTGVCCHSLLQKIFPTQGLNPGLLHCRQILYPLNHQVSPRILEWVAYPFSRGSSQLKSWTRVSCISGGFFTS